MTDEPFFSLDNEGRRGVADIIFPPSVSRIDGNFFAVLGEPVPERIFGAAVDIGTTTVAAYLIDINARRIAASLSVRNPQSEFGIDAASRLAFINENLEELGRLQRKIMSAVNALLAAITDKAGASVNDIYYVVVGGNSIMEHIFLGVNPGSADKAPFLPVFREVPTRRASALGVSIHRGGIIDVAPNISGHIGGDVVAGLIHTGLVCSEKISLYLDMGTNTEVLLGNRDYIYTCTTSSIPALEGGRVSSGMRSIAGALEGYEFENGKAQACVIGGGPATGLCGAGLLDVVAALQDENALTRGGELSTEHVPASHPFYNRITMSDCGEGRFEILTPQENKGGGGLFLTEKDIAEIRLAKGAIGLATEMLLDVTGLGTGDIDRVFISAPYASNMNVRSVKSIGLVPDVSDDRITFFGHSAGYGLCRMLLDKKSFVATHDILKLPHNIDISSYNNLRRAFEKHLSFKTQDSAKQQNGGRHQ